MKNKTITIEEMQALMKANKDKIQNDLIDDIVEKVELLLEKANRKDYEPTDHEREQFGKLVIIINNMNKWF